MRNVLLLVVLLSSAFAEANSCDISRYEKTIDAVVLPTFKKFFNDYNNTHKNSVVPGSFVLLAKPYSLDHMSMRLYAEINEPVATFLTKSGTKMNVYFHDYTDRWDSQGSIQVMDLSYFDKEGNLLKTTCNLWITNDGNETLSYLSVVNPKSEIRIYVKSLSDYSQNALLETIYP